MSSNQKLAFVIALGLVGAWISVIILYDIPEMRGRINSLEETVAHQDQSIDYLLKQDSIAHPLNWKR